MPHTFDTQLTGAAGEHLVLSRLLQRGLLAALAPRGTRKADVLVNFLDDGVPCLIQVKSRQFGSDGGWHMSEKLEQVFADDLIYCFVDFEPESPCVYVIPSVVVAQVISDDHRLWLATPGRNGQRHNDTSMRRVKRVSLSLGDNWLEQYRERWDLISERRSHNAIDHSFGHIPGL